MFFSEDGFEVSRFGERTLARYRQLAMQQLGEGCATGFVKGDDPVQRAVVQDWLNEFERACSGYCGYHRGSDVCTAIDFYRCRDQTAVNSCRSIRDTYRNLIMPNFYIDERFGAWQVGENPEGEAGRVQNLFPQQCSIHTQTRQRTPHYGDPRIESIQVVGDFMSALGLGTGTALRAAMTEAYHHAKGKVWSYTTPVSLPAGFYEYKYLVTFTGGTNAWSAILARATAARRIKERGGCRGRKHGRGHADS